MLRALPLLAVCCGLSIDKYAYDFPTGLFFRWESSNNGASGNVEYLPSAGSLAVRDDGDGWLTRRLVLAPGSADCKRFPNVTNDHRGQEAGVPYADTIILYMVIKQGSCEAGLATLFGRNSEHDLGVQPAAAIWMWSDESDDGISDESRFHLVNFDPTDVQVASLPMQTG